MVDVLVAGFEQALLQHFDWARWIHWRWEVLSQVPIFDI